MTDLGRHTDAAMRRLIDAMEPGTGKLIEAQPIPHGTVSVRGRFVLREAAQGAMEEYLDRWNPMGYGTILSMHQDGRFWIVEGSRLASCD